MSTIFGSCDEITLSGFVAACPILFQYLFNSTHIDIQPPPINDGVTQNFNSKTYKKSLFLKISPALVYYVKCDNFCMVQKLIDYAFRKKNDNKFCKLLL